MPDAVRAGRAGRVLVREGQLLVARNHGRTLFCLPGGRSEHASPMPRHWPREAREELSVTIDCWTLRHGVTVTAPRDGVRTSPQIVAQGCCRDRPCARGSPDWSGCHPGYGRDGHCELSPRPDNRRSAALRRGGVAPIQAERNGPGGAPRRRLVHCRYPGLGFSRKCGRLDPWCSRMRPGPRALGTVGKSHCRPRRRHLARRSQPPHRHIGRWASSLEPRASQPTSMSTASRQRPSAMTAAQPRLRRRPPYP